MWIQLQQRARPSDRGESRVLYPISLHGAEQSAARYIRPMRLSVTVMTKVTSVVNLDKSSNWTVAEAKAKLSEVIERAITTGPQIITRHGKKAVCVVSVDDWERKTKRVGTLAEFFSASSLGEGSLATDRLRDNPREIDL